jgi:hypothetical protein
MNEMEGGSKLHHSDTYTNTAACTQKIILSASITFTLMETAVVAKKLECLQHTMQLNHITHVMHKLLKNFTPVSL